MYKFSFSDEDQLRDLFEILRGQASSLEREITNALKKKMTYNRVKWLTNKCVETRTRLKDCIATFEQSMDSVIQVFKFFHSWPKSTSNNQKEIDAIDAKILGASKPIDVKNDEDGQGRLEIEE